VERLATERLGNVERLATERLALSSLTVVVPVLDEEACVAAALSSATGADEILVVDGGSRDRTVRFVRDAGYTVVEGPRGRALQMNAGARLARGDVLLFLHADTLLPPGFDRAIATALMREGAAWGRFDLRFDAGGPLLRLIARLISLRSRVSRVATGDQAIFVRRELFEALDGFAEVPLFEDVDLCRRLRGRGRMVVPDGYVVTSARRWRQRGTIRTSLLMWSLKLAYLAGVSPQRLAGFYRSVR
jgi:rSAM/selenodomain-associated transferase 2